MCTSIRKKNSSKHLKGHIKILSELVDLTFTMQHISKPIISLMLTVTSPISKIICKAWGNQRFHFSLKYRARTRAGIFYHFLANQPSITQNTKDKQMKIYFLPTSIFTVSKCFLHNCFNLHVAQSYLEIAHSHSNNVCK